MSNQSYMQEVFSTKLYGEMKISVMDADGGMTLYENIKKAWLEHSTLKIEKQDGQKEEKRLYKGYRVNGVDPEEHDISFPTPSSCYLTSACIEAKNLPDDCIELTTLREFRDGYVLYTNRGCMDIDHYYEIAPKIVSEINSHVDSKKIYEEIYNTIVNPSVKLIERGRLGEAYDLYKNKSLELERTYLN